MMLDTLKPIEVPFNAVPSSIGKLVKIQTFNRLTDKEIDYDSLQVEVGILEWYSHGPDGFSFKMQGVDGTAFLYAETYIEIYIKEDERYHHANDSSGGHQES